MRLTPEPKCDILAQVRAMLDPRHPKKAVFLCPYNDVPIVPPDVERITRPEGTLLTRDPELARLFAEGPRDDMTMATILGYPEDKGTALRKGVAWVLQACDAWENVITEAVCSEEGFDATFEALRQHGPIRPLTPLAAQIRRIRLRLAEK